MDGYGERLRAALAAAPDPAAPIVLVLVNYRSSALLAGNLPGGLAAAGIRVVVVDNYSDEAERAAMRTLAGARGWDLVEPSGNPGFGEGINLGVLRGAELGGRTFVTLNPDAVAEVETIRGLGEAAVEAPDSLISPLVLRPDGRPFFAGSTINMRIGRIRTGWVDGDDDPDWKNWLSGACLAFAGETFATLDGYADGYFLYWEDVDLSRRAAAHGIRLVVRDDLRVVHDEGGTHTESGSSGKSALYYYYNTRNRLLCGARLAERRDRTRWLLHTPRESYRIWRRGGRRQALTQPGGVLAAIRGTFSGLRLAWRDGRF